LVNATFLIYSARTDFSFIEGLKLCTIQPVLDEVAREIGLDVSIIIDIKRVNLKDRKKTFQIPKNRLKRLSVIDQNILFVAFEGKKSYLLVTDDKQIRKVGKVNRIRCLTTPKFIAFLVKHSGMDRKDAVEFLLKLRQIYTRPKEIDSAIEKMKRWK